MDMGVLSLILTKTDVIAQRLQSAAKTLVQTSDNLLVLHGVGTTYNNSARHWSPSRKIICGEEIVMLFILS